ncbi:MAG TPA: ATP-binding cassette domain-containing protein [Micromonospora sp.]|nr:ATP-binding cassette domain-containing protein [Micromonospora sp.]
MPVFTGLSLALDGRATVLLGPNGAGKSTLLSLIVGLLMPKRGAIHVDGMSSVSRRDRGRYRRHIGWLPQNVTAVPGLRVREQVAYAGWLKGLSRRDAWDRAATVLDRMDLTDLSERPAHALSGGQLRRVGIAQALVHEAQIVLMDEPTAGLDPMQRHKFRDTLIRIADHVRFVVSTHQTEDLSDIYEDVVVLDRGQVRYQGGVAEFLHSAAMTADPARRAEEAYIRLLSVTD